MTTYTAYGKAVEMDLFDALPRILRDYINYVCPHAPEYVAELYVKHRDVNIVLIYLRKLEENLL